MNIKCSFDPRTVTGPIGMFHCPECGEMVIAGMNHLSSLEEFDSDELTKELTKLDK